MKKYDKVRFMYGNSLYTRTFIEESRPHNSMKLTFAGWVTIQPWTKPEVIGRSWRGKIVDWWNGVE